MRRFGTSAIAVLLVLAFVAFGCSPAPSAAPQAGAKPSAGTPAPAGPSGILRVALSNFVDDQLDPMLATPAAINNINPMYDDLVGGSPDGKMGPGVAESWDLSADGRTWTFHLRKGLLFQDNWGEVTGEDVKFSIERLFAPESKALWSGTLKKGIKSIDVVDPYTVRISTNSLMLDLPYMLSSLASIEGMVVPKRYLSEKGVEEFRVHPIGSGPFKLVQHVPGNKFEYQAVTDPAYYKNHYRKMPAFERLILTMVPEEGTRTAMLQTGEADIADVSAESVDALQAAGLRLGQAPMAYQLNLHLWDTYRPEVAKMPVANLKVRQALSLAINREEVVKFLLKGYGDAATLPVRVFPFVADIDADALKTYSQKAYRFDPAEAKRLLSEAGYDGSEISFYSYAQAGVPVEPKLVEAIAGYWSAVGVKSKMLPIEFGGFKDLWNTKPHNPKILGTASILQAPPRYLITSSLELTFHSKGSIGVMEDPQVDKLIEALGSEPNEAKRRETMKQAIQLTADSMTATPVVYVSGLYGLSNNVGEWKAVPGAAYALGLTYENTTKKVK